MTGDCCNNVLTITVPLCCKFLLTVLKETCVEKLPIMVKKKKKRHQSQWKTQHLVLARFTEALCKIQSLPNSVRELFLRISGQEGTPTSRLFQEYKKLMNKPQLNLQEPHATSSRLSKKRPQNTSAAHYLILTNGKT